MQNVTEHRGRLSGVAVLHMGSRGGATISLLHLLRLFERHGAAEIVMPAGERSPVDLPPVPVTELRYGPLVFPRGPLSAIGLVRRLVGETRRFRHLFKAKRPDLVIVSTSTLPTALLAARMERIPTLTRVAEIYRSSSEAGSPRAFAARVLLAATERLSGSIICASHGVARQFSSRGTGRIFVAYPQIAPAAPQGDGQSLRTKLGIAADAPVVAAAGALSRGRGQDILIKAIALIREELPEARCIIAGAPHERAPDRAFARELVRMTEELGLRGAVHLTGSCSRMQDLYAAADLVVNPARTHEAFGRVAAEALVSGKPVISSRVGAVPEVLTHERDALLVAPEDPRELASAILRLLRDPELAGRIVERGRRRILEACDGDRAAAVLAAAVAEATAR